MDCCITMPLTLQNQILFWKGKYTLHYRESYFQSFLQLEATYTNLLFYKARIISLIGHYCFLFFTIYLFGCIRSSLCHVGCFPAAHLLSTHSRSSPEGVGGFSRCAKLPQLCHRMWDLGFKPGIKPMSPALQGKFLTTRTLEK